MDTGPLKLFAVSARTELIREVGARITGVLASGSPERVEQPRAVYALERAIAGAGGGHEGRAHVVDRVAYTWFNRIIALRFMDVNGYTGVGVVSPAADQVGQPEVLAAAKRGQVDTDVVKEANASTVAGLLNGTRQPRPGVDAQAEAYALLLADYCRFWNAAMPFMFEREGDYTELLIPGNLLAGDSVLSRSVSVLTADVCRDVEVIGWLYQFYILERKDEVFAGFRKNKKAGADEIPAATQLFTPHWIVRYLVENSLGRLWMLNHPLSGLASQMDYYIAPVDEETDFLKIAMPEELTVIDPACGSGHMLTYAFDLLYAIYEEEGYAPSEIPTLILTHNLYGTEIDPRAGALAAFALTMKAAAKRKLFLKNPVEPNICVLDPITFSADELDYLVTKAGDRQAEEAFWNQFTEADTLGSLICPERDVMRRLRSHLEALEPRGDLFLTDVTGRASRVAAHAEYLAGEYAVSVTNPPYMGSGNMGASLADYVKKEYANYKQDLYACFINRTLNMTVPGGVVALVTGDTWMFIKSFQKLREELIASASIASLVHLHDAGNLPSKFGANSAFVVTVGGSPAAHGVFIRTSLSGVESKRQEVDGAFNHRTSTHNWFEVSTARFSLLPGSSIAYWLPDAVVLAFDRNPTMESVCYTRIGLITGSNDRYIREWYEVSFREIGFGLSRAEARDSGRRWFPVSKGGEYRKWYGNVGAVVDWSNDGKELQTRLDPTGSRVLAHNFNLEDVFNAGVAWSKVSSSRFSARIHPIGFIFNDPAATAFPLSSASLMSLLAYLASMVPDFLLRGINPTLNFQPGNVLDLPWAAKVSVESAEQIAEHAVSIAERDWNSQETSFGFQSLAVSAYFGSGRSLSEILRQVAIAHRHATDRMVELEESNNRLFIEALGLTEVLTPEVRRADVTLLGNVDYTYADIADVDGRDSARSAEAVRELVSWSVGCMFGRYSLDEPGLILADQGVTVQDYLAKVPSPTFAPDGDNVIPMVEGDWFEDDIAGLFRRFLRAAFGEENFEENLNFVTDSLGVKNLRDYFITRTGRSKFYNDHVQRYKRRPIYWLFSSPKGSFNALIYMHRYTSSTVSTVLTYLREYVTKLESALQHAERAGNAKEADRLRKVLVELNEYEHDTLYPLASRNVAIDLDDGVKANYPMFGTALKKVTGLEASGD